MCEVCHLEHEPEYPCEAALASERSALWQERAVKAERLLLELRQEDNDCDEKLEKAERIRQAEAKIARVEALVARWWAELDDSDGADDDDPDDDAYLRGRADSAGQLRAALTPVKEA
ncbi:hypothetical protein LCGC14_0587640 [marine sediment metagenome]|uniref:Uncharacterized protein n=1 Tax=marine sediment metagenome TaxID=412755 RepID=A0A0F9U0K8_9ZZZZ